MYTITNTQVYLTSGSKGKLRAYARVMLDDQLQLTGLRLFEGAQGLLFVSYPNDSSHGGEDYKQIYYPVTKELRDLIENTIILEYLITVHPELEEAVKGSEPEAVLRTLFHNNYGEQAKKILEAHARKILGSL